MKKIKAKAYTSSDMVLLAFDWYDGKNKNDFLGFAIKRNPGFHKAEESWLPNRLNFTGSAKVDDKTGKIEVLPTDKYPIQKFMWWDANFEDGEKNKTYTYTIYATTGTAENIIIEEESKEIIQVILNDQSKSLIKTFFNRAIVSSQAFSNRFIKNDKFDEKRIDEALEWLSNGLGEVIPNFIIGAGRIDGAIYHLDDKKWIIPAFMNFNKTLSIVYHSHADDHKNDYAIKTLDVNPNVEFWPRTHTSIMHNKFLVWSDDTNSPKRILMGSANFTTEGLSEQANLYHIFESPELASLFLLRKNFLHTDPSKLLTQNNSGWSKSVKIGSADVRLFLFPEKSPNRDGMNVVIDAINNAKQSVLFCILLDVDNGPEGLARRANNWLYSPAGLEAALDALRPKGVLAVWSAAPSGAFIRRMRSAGFWTEEICVGERGPQDGPRTTIFIGSARPPGF